ncbi:uncharacterized protein LOC106666349 [Cimex lectularius]|uniref:Complex I-15 kDa n=1 Tax=Cimex lectularius TaxID=79782 RepID=A0A8I6TH66_CIMLE|nr:uncharacterized protein LOC106666349 [Cimex lectularius]
MTIFPFIKTPLTDLTGHLLTHQEGPCGDFEMKFVNCQEAYGERRAFEKCADILADLEECFSHQKQNMRVYEMRTERLRQIKSGELSKEEAFLPGPKVDSY